MQLTSQDGGDVKLDIQAKTAGATYSDSVLCFKNLSYRVKDRDILRGLNGVLSTGEMVAILGPSGAGKTTFLDLISARKTSGEIEGEVVLDGEAWNTSMKLLFAYVEQTSALLGTLSVREMLMYTARLVHHQKTIDEMTAIVDDVLSVLNLTKCADTRIGDENTRGISGGEVKRIDVALQLLKRPVFLFLDEPTSGLDYAMARDVVLSVKRLTQDNERPIHVLSTIHQPAADIFDCFDNLILLHEGQLCFHGRVKDAAGFLDAAGAPSPSGITLPDRIIDAVSAEGADFAAIWAKSAESKAVLERLEDGLNGVLRRGSDGKQAEKAQRGSVTLQLAKQEYDAKSHLKNLMTLVKYRWMACTRSKAFMAPRIAVRSVMAFMVATGWVLGVRESGSLGIHIRITYLFFTTLFLAITSSTSAPTVIADRPVFMREQHEQLYSTAVYVIAKLLIELPPLLIGCTIYAIVTYYSLEMRSGGFGFFYIALCAFGTSSIAWTHAIVSLCANVENATSFSALSSIVQVLFMGFFVPRDNVPPWWRWINHVSPFKYTFEGFLLNEFEDDKDPHTVCLRGTDPPVCAELVGMDAAGIFETPVFTKWENLGIVVGIACIYCCLAYTFTAYMSRILINR
mmetsp:Transcript_7734/g.25662  ORF Transcript_7734/g.25662 Transcript_7734/m.25662 type:complete len:627 (+) Transcript_7734:37-1917(+)